MVKADDCINQKVAEKALQMLEIDEWGLDMVDRMILEAIIYKFNGGPVGLETLAAAVSAEQDTLTDVYEPYLLKMGLIQKTPRGRIATELAYRHLGLRYPRQMESNGLFSLSDE